MHSIEEFLSLSSAEQLSIVRNAGKLVLSTTVDGRHHSYYVYANFFVEVEHEEHGTTLLRIDVLRGGQKVTDMLRVLEQH